MIVSGQNMQSLELGFAPLRRLRNWLNTQCPKIGTKPALTASLIPQELRHKESRGRNCRTENRGLWWTGSGRKSRKVRDQSTLSSSSSTLGSGCLRRTSELHSSPLPLLSILGLHKNCVRSGPCLSSNYFLRERKKGVTLQGESCIWPQSLQ